MSLQNIKNMKSDKGFTIVELLIVIVVIGILAAITIVAYNGIQNRGKTAAGQSLANTISKKAQAYNTIESTFPTKTQLTDGSAPEEAQVEDASSILVVTSTTPLTAENANGGETVGYALCAGNTGATISYWDYAAATPAAVTKTVGDC